LKKDDRATDAMKTAGAERPAAAICIDCRLPISVYRLALEPHVTRCARCANEHERKRAQPNPTRP
jgi:RNA polymerase-binding transcription factor DksA